MWIFYFQKQKIMQTSNVTLLLPPWMSHIIWMASNGFISCSENEMAWTNTPSKNINRKLGWKNEPKKSLENLRIAPQAEHWVQLVSLQTFIVSFPLPHLQKKDWWKFLFLCFEVRELVTVPYDCLVGPMFLER